MADPNAVEFYEQFMAPAERAAVRPLAQPNDDELDFLISESNFGVTASTTALARTAAAGATSNTAAAGARITAAAGRTPAAAAASSTAAAAAPSTAAAASIAAGSDSATTLRHAPMRRAVETHPHRTSSELARAVASVVPAVPFDSTLCSAATIGNGVEVKASTLGAKAGLGLFATRHFATGDLITEYDGCVIEFAEAKLRQEKKIATHIRTLGPMQASIDGLKVPNEKWRGGASFANDSFGRPPYNSKWDEKRPGKAITGVNRGGCNVFERVFLRAVRPIAPGDEVFVDYGKGFWDLYPIA